MSFGKTKKCKYCKERFEYVNSFQPFCFKEECIKEHNLKHKAKKSRELKKEFKENDKSTLKELAQKLVNQYVRLRDLNSPCISCGYIGNGRKWNAGHFKPQGNNQQLRYYTLNIFIQCEQCNSFKSGNLVPYRENLIKKIGLNKVEWLESNHETKKYDVEYLQRLIKIFRKKIKLYQTKFR
jgi:hypothetical protein